MYNKKMFKLLLFQVTNYILLQENKKKTTYRNTHQYTTRQPTTSYMIHYLFFFLVFDRCSSSCSIKRTNFIKSLRFKPKFTSRPNTFCFCRFFSFFATRSRFTVICCHSLISSFRSFLHLCFKGFLYVNNLQNISLNFIGFPIK